MIFRQIFILTILILVSLTSLGQTKQKTILFSECDTTKNSRLDLVANTEIKSSDEKITKWLVKKSSDKKLNTSAEFKFILDNQKGVCLKALTVFDSTNVNLKDLTNLISKLADFPEFKQVAKNSSTTKLLVGLVYLDKQKNKFKIGLELLMID
jgi:hypothetical protein